MQSLKWRIATSALIIVFFNPALGEISLDGTVGPKATLDGPDYTIPHTVGSTAGTNLFHSFDRFDIAKNESATFTGPAGLDNVISRVTGDDCSNIDGLLRSTIPGADFWFINPSGVFFGPDAQVNVPAAFHVSTADEIRFSDGSAFNAAEPNAGPLSVASPEAFGFISQNPAGISFQGSKLEVAEGNTLSIVGGDITMKGGSVTAPSGRINVASIASPGEVQPTDEGAHVSTVTAFADITASNSEIDVSGPGAGRIFIRGNRLVMENSDLSAENGSDHEAPKLGVDISLSEDLSMSSGGISVNANTGGDAAGIHIEADRIELTSGATIEGKTIPSSPDAGASGDGGTVTIKAKNGSVSLKHANVRTSAGTNSGDTVGNSGSVTITASASVTFEDFSGIFTSVSSTGNSSLAGNAGAVTITAKNGSVSLKKNSSVQTGIAAGFSSLGGGTAGNAGAVTITAGESVIFEDSFISSETTALRGAAAGNAGAVTITAKNGSVSLKENSSVRASADGGSYREGTVGNAGAVTISAEKGSVLLKNRSSLSSATFADADGTVGDTGALTVTAGESVTLDDSYIGNSPGRDTASDAGAVSITVNNGSILLKNHSSLSTATFTGGGAGGTITLKASHNVSLTNEATVTAQTFGSANGGNISISTMGGNLTVAGSSRITSESSDTGDAGNVDLFAGNVITIDGGLIVTQASEASGGNIRLTAPRLIELIDSNITSSVIGESETKGGNINIGTNGDTIISDNNFDIDPRFLVLDESNILAQAKKGRGGDIKVVSDYIIRSAGSDINAQAGPEGIDGTVVLGTPEIDLQKGLVELPVVFVNAASQVRRSCEARRNVGESAFTEEGRGGVPPEPGAGMPAFYTLGADGNETIEPAGGRPAEYEGLTSIPPARVAIVCGSLQ
jgi:filamentous hemagglutinin family protein